jgi:hypothetical protein
MLDTLRFNNKLMGFMLNLEIPKVRMDNFNELKVKSLATIKTHQPHEDYSFHGCNKMISSLIMVWIPNQEDISDIEYDNITQTIYTLISDSLEN